MGLVERLRGGNGGVKVLVRKARAADAPEIRRLLEALGYQNSLRQVKDRLARFRRAKAATVLVAQAGTKFAGLVSLDWFEIFHLEGFNCRMTAMIVDPEIRRQGVGRKLVAAAERVAKKAGCWRLEVTSGLKRRGAHTFYVKQGLEFTSKRFSRQLEN